MEKAIFYAIDNQTSQNKLLDFDTIWDITEIFRIDYNLEDYLICAISKELPIDWAGYYNRATKILSFWMPNFYNWLKKEYPNASLAEQNFLIAYHIMHEFSHVLQMRKINTEENLEVEMLRLANKKFYSKMPILNSYRRHRYIKYHSLFPNERLADIDAITTVIDMVNFLGYDNSLFTSMLKDFKNRDYGEDGTSPLEKFESLVHTNLLEEQWFYDENRNTMCDNLRGIYSLEERVRLGLPIDKQELHLIRHQ